MTPNPRQRGRHWMNSGMALASVAGICLLACTGSELPLEGEAENGGAGDTAGAVGGVSGQNGASAGSAGRASAGKGGDAGRGTGGGGAVAGGKGGDGPEGGTGASAASSSGGQATGGSSAGAPPVAGQAGGSSTTCDAESYLDSETMRCRPSTVCAPGERVGLPPATNSDRTCAPCDDGTFSTIENSEACWSCGLCGSLGVTAACTTSRNTTCGQTGRVVQFGTSGTDQAAAVAVDGAGNVWVTGYTFQGNSNANGGGAFVQKIPNDGSARFYEEFGSTSDLRPRGIAVDHQGNVWVTGFFDGTFENVDSIRYQAFARKYPSDGSAPVTDVFGSSESDQGEAVTVDSAGNVWIAGTTNGDLARANMGSYDLFARIYPPDGSAPVTHQFGTASVDWLGGIAADDTGKIWVAAATDMEGTESSLANFDATVWQLQADGSTPFTDRFGGPEEDSPWGIAADHAGNVWVAGMTRLGPAVPNLDFMQIFVRKYPADGSPPVTERFGLLDDFVNAITVDASGNVWVVGGSRCNLAGGRLERTDSGTYYDPILLNTYSLDELCAPADRGMGERDVYVREYPADGGPARSYQFGSMWDDYTKAVAPGVSGDVWLFGDAEGNLGQFDPANGPGYDLFLWQITPKTDP